MSMVAVINALYVAASFGLLAAGVFFHKLQRSPVSSALLVSALIVSTASIARRGLEYWSAEKVQSFRDLPSESLHEANTAFSEQYFQILVPLIWTQSIASLAYASLLGWLAYKLLSDKGREKDAT